MTDQSGAANKEKNRDFVEKQHDLRLYYLHVTTRSLPNARNLGLSKACGEIVRFTDDDVILLSPDPSPRLAEELDYYTRWVLSGPIVPLQQSVVQYHQQSSNMVHGAQLNPRVFGATIAKVVSPSGPSVDRLDPAKLSLFERRKRAGVLRCLRHQRQNASAHLQLLAAFFRTLSQSGYDRIALNVFARAVLTSISA